MPWEPAEVRTRLVALETHRLIASRPDGHAKPLRRVFYATPEGRRAAGIKDARAREVF